MIDKQGHVSQHEKVALFLLQLLSVSVDGKKLYSAMTWVFVSFC